MNFPSQIFFNDINDGYRPAILKKLFVAASIQYGFAYLILLWKGVQNDQTSLITLNMIGYAGIYLKKKKKTAEYARILNVSDAVHMRRSLYKLLSSYLDGYSEHC